jgi:cytochrome c-type biogenesis protein
MELYNILIAFVGGVLSFLSPCVLPLVPGYISLISGVSVENLKDENESQTSARRAVVLNSLAFNAGLSLIFLLLGAGFGFIGAAITSNIYVRITGALVIIIFGLHLIGILKISALYRDTRKFSDEKPRGIFGAFALGIAFAAGWTPCIGPILGGIIGLAATSGGWRSGLVLTAFYSAGLAVPFLLTGLGINQFLRFYSSFKQHLHKVEVASGIVLIFIGVLIASNNLTWLSGALVRWLPSAENLVKLKENNSTSNAPQNVNGGATNNADNGNYKLAPEAELKTLDGQPFQLASLRGRVVLLNFWATWCVPCRGEIPDLNKLHQDYEKSGLSVVGVLTDDSTSELPKFHKDIKQDYMLIVGSDDSKAKYEAVGLPTSYIIDREGRIRQKIVGPRTRGEFEAMLRPLLTEGQTASK